MTGIMTELDISHGPAIIKTDAPAMAIGLGRYQDGDFITKKELGQALGCSERTLQRMVERFEIPPPMSLAGRKVWLIGKLKTWLSEVAERKESEAMREARRLKVFQ